MPRHVQVKATKPRIQYVADGSRCDYVFPFAVFTASGLEVYINAVRQTSGFAIKGIGQTDGGSVLFATPPAAGAVVTLRRQLVLERTSDFQESGQFRAKILNDELDYLTAAIQEVQAETERSIRLEPFDRDSTLTLPNAAERAGKAIVFDEKGDLTTKPVAGLAIQATTPSLDAISEGSTNKHYTQVEKSKLSGIEEGAQVNPRPVTAEEKAGAVETALRGYSPVDVKDMVVLHAPKTNAVTSVHGRTGEVTAQAGDYSTAQIVDTPERVIMSSAERAKLAGIASGAQVNTVESVHGRAGQVTAQTGDYSAEQISDSPQKVIMTVAERQTLASLATATSRGSDSIANESSVPGATLSDAIEAAAAIGVSGDAFAALHATTSGAHGSDAIVNKSSVDGKSVSDALDSLHALSSRDSAWQDPVLDVLATPPSSPQSGARYIVDASPIDAWAGHAGDVATWNGSSWQFVKPALGWTVIVLDELAEYRFGPTTWSPTGAAIAADRITGVLGFAQVGKIDTGRLLGRVADGQGNAQQISVSQGLQLTADGDLRLSGATPGSTIRSFFGRDATGAYGFRDILSSDVKGVAARRLLGNATTTVAEAGEIPIGIGSAGSIPTLSDADGRYLRKSFADSASTVASVAADDLIVLNDTSAAGAAVRAPLSALPFVQSGQKACANGVGSLNANGRQPIAEAADGAAEERAFVVTAASYTVSRRVLIARDGCNEIILTPATAAYKNVYISNEKPASSLTVRAAAGENINGLATLSLSSGQSVGLVVIDGSPPNSWKGEIAAAASPQGPLTIVSNRGHVSNASTTSSGINRDVLYRLAYWTTKRSAVTGLRLVYANIGLLATGEADGLATMYPRASIEYGGVTRRVYFNGRREGVVEPGGVLISDPVGIRIPPDTQFWIRSLARTANAGEQYYHGYSTRDTFGEGFVTSPGVLDSAGALASAQAGGLWPVAAVLGITEEWDPPSCVIIGSSSAWGQGENFGGLTPPADRGYLARFVSTNFGYTVLASGSQTAAQWVADPSRRLAFLAAVRPTIVICQLGTNDIANGNSFDTVRNNLLEMWRSIANLGIRVYPTTFTTRTTSTDGWKTLENQTVTANEAVRVKVNDFIRGVPAPCSGLLDVADLTESARNSGKWKIAGGAWTSDGIHTIRHADIAAGLCLSALSVN